MSRPKKPTKTGPTKDDARLQELTEALQRERADAVNLRRRHEEEIAGLRGRAKASVVRDLLPVIDNFERAMKHHPTPELKNLSGEGDRKIEWVRGINKIYEQFEKTLADMGVERIKTVGEHFDPHLHEAVDVEEGDGKHEIVSEELQAGYKLGDQVIRHAIVKVKG